MKNILKFLLIFISSLLLAVVFGYWFGRLNSLLTGNIVFGNFILPASTQLATIVVGFPFAYLLFFSFLTILLNQNNKNRIVHLLIGTLFIVIFLFSYKALEGFLGLLMLLLGLLLGELILFAKKKLKKSASS